MLGLVGQGVAVLGNLELRHAFFPCAGGLVEIIQSSGVPRSNGAAVVPLQMNRPPLRSCAGSASVEMDSPPSIVAWNLTALGGLVRFETQRANLLCKIYVAKIPGVMSRAELCGFWARIAVS